MTWYPKICRGVIEAPIALLDGIVDIVSSSLFQRRSKHHTRRPPVGQHRIVVRNSSPFPPSHPRPLIEVTGRPRELLPLKDTARSWADPPGVPTPRRCPTTGESSSSQGI